MLPAAVCYLCRLFNNAVYSSLTNPALCPLCACAALCRRWAPAWCGAPSPPISGAAHTPHRWVREHIHPHSFAPHGAVILSFCGCLRRALHCMVTNVSAVCLLLNSPEQVAWLHACCTFTQHTPGGH